MAYVFRKQGSKFWYAGWRDEFGKPRKLNTRIEAKTGKDGKPIEKYRLLAYEKAKSAEDQARDVKFGQAKSTLSHITYRELVAKYLEVQASRYRSHKDIKQRLEKYVVPILGSKVIGEIRPVHIMETLNKARQTIKGRNETGEASPQVIQHIRNHISATFKFAIRVLKELRENPVASVPNEVIPDKDPAVIDPELIPVIIAHASEEWRGVFAVAAYTGMRKGEILALKFEDIDLGAGAIRVARSNDSKTTKGGRTRHLPIHPELESYLKLEFGRKRSEYVFPDSKGNRRHKDVKLERRLREACRRADITIGYDHKCRRKGCGFSVRRADGAASKCPQCGFTLWVHGVAPKWCFKDLRSTFGTLTYEATGDLRITQRLLGHAQLDTTDKAYAKMRYRRLSEELKKLKYPAISAAPQALPEGSALTGTDSASQPKVVRLQGVK